MRANAIIARIAGSYSGLRQKKPRNEAGSTSGARRSNRFWGYLVARLLREVSRRVTYALSK